MKRFFAFGCSFTKYVWPTWADLLGQDFKESYNYGFPGVGNRAIMERVMEAHARHKFTQDDVVVIQWSSHIRFDWHMPVDLTKIGRPRIYGWQTSGSVYSPMNSELFPKQWHDIFFNEESYMMHSLNAIMAVTNLLKLINCSWYMTAMRDLETLHSDATSIVSDKSTINRDKNALWETFPDLRIYKESLFDDLSDKWLPSIEPWLTQNSKEEYYTFLDKKGNPWEEGHPSVEQQVDWMTKNLRHLVSDQTNTEHYIETANIVRETIVNTGQDRDAMGSSLFQAIQESDSEELKKMKQWKNTIIGL